LDPTRIIGGATFCTFNNQVSYGGYIKKELIAPSEELKNVDYLNGNFVIVPKYVMENIGILDSYFHHALGDFDYTLRAKKNGFELKLLPFYIGDCESNRNKHFWSDSSNNIIERMRYLYSPMSGCKFPEFFVFDLRHRGMLLSVFHFFTIHMRAIFPWLGKLSTNDSNPK
jgi:GT2 family glycosyltransferase